jgi:hypothetical protein
MRKGMAARYRIPPFNAFAGRSPICWAVLVQIEHCAIVKAGRRKDKKASRRNACNHFFIASLFTAKIRLREQREKEIFACGILSDFGTFLPCNFPLLALLPCAIAINTLFLFFSSLLFLCSLSQKKPPEDPVAHQLNIIIVFLPSALRHQNFLRQKLIFSLFA